MCIVNVSARLYILDSGILHSTILMRADREGQSSTALWLVREAELSHFGQAS